MIATHNRSVRLATALRCVLAQTAREPTFEIIVVDNNSSDGTRELVEVVAHIDAWGRYLFEPRQGVSHARNAGIAEARAPIVAFTDDDVCVSPEWTTAIGQAFQHNPWADFVGGRVLPSWPRAVPSWLTPRLLVAARARGLRHRAGARGPREPDLPRHLQRRVPRAWSGWRMITSTPSSPTLPRGCQRWRK